ncbi:unnamed protein product, partial [Polarella glacialis]
FNRVYVRQTTSSFLVAAPREGLDLVTRCGAERRGPWVYVAVADPTDGCEGRPYLWLQSLGKGWQWKLAVSGEQKSRYGSWLRRSGEFPRGLGPWQSLECRTRSQLEVRLVQGKLGEAEQSGSQPRGPVALRMPHPEDPVDLPKLGLAEAASFWEDGYLILRAGTLGTQRRTQKALRAMNIVLGELASSNLERRPVAQHVHLLEEGDREGVQSVRVRASEEYLNLLCPVWPLLTRMLGEEPCTPLCCQLAYAMPEGLAGDDFEGRADSRDGTSYHIDGRGRIPNEFALLVGVALSPPPAGSLSWGALTVFPGSHRNSELQRAYPSQFAGVEVAADLGAPVHLELEPGDMVIAHSLLAHRRAENWSAVPRYQVYFRLRPSRAERDQKWNSGLPADPFAVLPGVSRARTQFRLEADPSEHAE